MQWNRSILLACILCLAFVATPKNCVQAQEKPVYGGTLTVGWEAACKTLDPHKSVQWPERPVLYCVFETLVNTDESFSIVPGLAKSWEMPDPKMWVFHLREGVKFHDGTDFNAEAVKWNLERVMDPEFASPHKNLLAPYIESLEVVDNHTLNVHLKQPYAPFLSSLAERPGFMVSPTAVKKMGDKKFALNPVGTGPFKFVRWMQQSQLELAKNGTYWDKDKPYLDKIVFKEIPDPVVRETSLRTGSIDLLTDIVAKQAVELQKTGQFEIVKNSPPVRWFGMCWRVDKEPFNNKALRQAVAYGINREEINDKLMYGEAMLPIGPVEPGLWWFEKDSKGYSYDPEMAKKKLIEAGYPDGFSFTFTVPNIQYYVRLAELLQSQLKQVGINMEFEMVNHAEAYAKMRSGESNWSMGRWTQRADPHGLLSIVFHSKGHANTSRYSNPRVDELLDQAATIYDQEKRKPLYYEAVRIITEDAPWVYLFYNPEWAVMAPKVNGFKWIPDMVPRFSFLWKEK